MKNKKPNAELVWKQLEDLLAPRLRLSVIDRTVYSHLLRHSRLEGKLRLRFSILRLGRNPYRNLVSSCMECNAQKGEKPADDFLRRLYRERRLTATELAARLRALDALASGKLRPSLPN